MPRGFADRTAGGHLGVTLLLTVTIAALRGRGGLPGRVPVDINLQLAWQAYADQ
jgi:hypothetical protein